jgi:hypothetical protein
LIFQLEENYQNFSELFGALAVNGALILTVCGIFSNSTSQNFRKTNKLTNNEISLPKSDF